MKNELEELSITQDVEIWNYISQGLIIMFGYSFSAISSGYFENEDAGKLANVFNFYNLLEDKMK